MKPPIQYRPKAKKKVERVVTTEVLAPPVKPLLKPEYNPDSVDTSSEVLSDFVSRGAAAQDAVNAEIEKFKKAEREKVLLRVQKHRQKKKLQAPK